MMKNPIFDLENVGLTYTRGLTQTWLNTAISAFGVWNQFAVFYGKDNSFAPFLQFLNFIRAKLCSVHL